MRFFQDLFINLLFELLLKNNQPMFKFLLTKKWQRN